MVDPLPDPDSAPAVTTAPGSAGQPAAGPDGAPATRPDALAPRSESRTTRLYRAALGPVNIAHYLQVFERFDAAGRRRLLWHPAAGLFTLGWLVFRRLWTEALVYGLLVAAVAGLCLWAWPAMQAWPTGVRWGVLGSLLLPGVLLPGLLGHGLLHRQVQRRLLRAVSASHSMDEARAALAQQAATRRRLWVVVTVHVAVVAALGLVWSGEERKPAVAVLPTTAPAAAVPPHVPAVPANAALVKTGQEVQAMAVEIPAVSVAVPDPAVRALPATGQPMPEVAERTEAAAPAQSAETAQTTPAAPPDAQRPEEPVAAAPYAINVGLFADEGNARRAQQLLQQAGLPVLVQAIPTRKGPRTRVRVGPYPQREAADEAAARIRALGLEAVVFRP
jgi:cell division septation protein DedD